ncbi:MAG: 16S rRNA (cytidine(1402)-2'-O)-methyltransferase [Kyrpidia tusciae]|nr:16S rRNA (cytidine(1402)-2'-O)-methyltransferase [Kyrpidia tusciae]MBE3552176.1 16S rRNA (cytidine(1402)-2'-O)-methyltransferase [Kyrpidia tusciae]
MDSQFSFDGPHERGLVLVATPIGNLEDISARALRVLGEADVILAEDTRRTRQLLAHFQISGPRLVSYHEHNRIQREPDVLDWLKEGKLVALVTDAGMPAISDPGADLVRLARNVGAPVTVVPGPSAALAALVISGLPTDRFVFLGFLPRSGRAREEEIARLAGYPETIILYEAPHRVIRTVRDLARVLGNRRAAAVRELTKRYEQVVRGTLGELIGWLEGEEPKGEWVLIVEGAVSASSEHHMFGEGGSSGEDDMNRWCEEVTRQVAEGVSVRDAIRETAQRHRISRRALYQAYLKRAEGNG